MKNIKDYQIKEKLSIISFITAFIVMIALLFYYLYEYKIISNDIHTTLKNSNDSVLKMVELSYEINSGTLLIPVLEQEINEANKLNSKLTNKNIPKNRIISEFSTLLSKKEFKDNIHIFLANKNGDIINFENISFLNRSNVQIFKKYMKENKSFKLMNGIPINKGFLIIKYYEKWDLYFVACIESALFSKMLSLSNLKDKILSIKSGKSGYSYIIDTSGSIVIHHSFQNGYYWYNALDKKGVPFIKEITKKRNGEINYLYKLPSEKYEKERIATFSFIPGLNWIVVTTIYLEEFAKPILITKITFLIIFLFLIILYLFQERVLRKYLVTPLIELLNNVKDMNSRNQLTLIEVFNTDEIGELTLELNNFINSIKNYQNNLEGMVHEKTNEINKAYHELKILNTSTQQHKEFINLIFETIPEPIFYKNDKFQYTMCNTAFESFLGMNSSEIIGKTVQEVFSEDFAKLHHKMDEELFYGDNYYQKYESPIRTNRGEVRNIVFNKSICKFNGKNIGIIGVMHDVTELRKLEVNLREESFIDPLTNLYNRRGLDYKFGEISILNRPLLGVLLIDIDHFKLYNDYYGHLKGDDCIILVSSIIKTISKRNNTIVARYGGEEFVVLSSINTPDEIISLGKKINKEILKSKIDHINNTPLKYVSVSIGVGIGKSDETLHYKDIIEEADKKLYLAKSLGRNKVIF